MVQSPAVRHVLPAVVAAGAAVCVSKYGSLLGRAYVTGLRTLPSAGLGIISGLFYSITFDALSFRTHLPALLKHSIAILTSAVATTGAAFAAASLGLIAMPSLPALATLIGAAILCDMLFRAIFGGPHPTPGRQPQLVELPQLPQPPQPNQVPAPPRRQPIFQPPKPPENIILPGVGVAKKDAIKPWASQAADHPETWSWPADLSKIGLSERSKQQIEDFLKEVVPQIAADGKIPDALKKGDSYYIKKGQACVINGKSWTLPRTLYFAEDPNTHRLAAILLNVSTKNVPALGKGGQRVVKVCYNLTAGQRVVKKAACGAYEVELLKKLNGTPGFEQLSQVRVTQDARKPGQVKARLITPLYDGSLDKLLSTNPNLASKDIRGMMISYFKGLERLHAEPGRSTFPDGRKCNVRYKSYHLDISPQNLLYKLAGGTYEGVVTDAGTVNDLPHLWHKRGWLSPEKDKQINAFAGEKENVDYLTRLGQHDDIWNMGLVLTCLLKGSQFHAFSHKSASGLTQRDVDAEIARNKPAVASLTMNRNAKSSMWDIARQLLQVDPQKRLTATQAREAFERVVA